MDSSDESKRSALLVRKALELVVVSLKRKYVLIVFGFGDGRAVEA